MDKARWVRIGVAALVLFVAGLFLKLAQSILVPFALALLFAFAVSPALDHLVRRRVPKAAALVLILVVSFAALYLVGMVFYSSGKTLASELPSYTEMVRELLAKIDSLVPDPRLKVGLTDWIEGFNIGKVGAFLVGALGPFASFMSDLLLVFAFMIFILAGRGRMVRKFGVAFPPAQAETLSRTFCRIDREVQRYVAVKTLDNLVIGILVAAVLAILGVRFALLFGVLAVFFNYVPVLGPIASVAMPALLALFLEGGLSLKVWLVLVLLIGIHLAVDRLLERRLMTKEISLSPLLVLFSLFFWAWLWGIPGMILAVPLLTAARIVFDNVPALRSLGAMMDR